MYYKDFQKLKVGDEVSFTSSTEFKYKVTYKDEKYGFLSIEGFTDGLYNFVDFIVVKTKKKNVG